MGTYIRLLGRFSVSRDGEEIPPSAFGGRRTRTLIRILVSRGGGFVSRDALVEALWPKAPPADPVMNINVLVRRARNALHEPSLIRTGPGGYSFAPSDCVVDAELFLTGVSSGRRLLAQGRSASALGEFLGALEYWGEPLAEDAYEEWAQDYRASLWRARLEALEGGAAAALTSGDPGRAVYLSELAVVQEPLREASHLLLVRALASSRDTAAALAAFERLRSELADNLGLDPSAEACELQGRILRGETLLGAAPPPVTRPVKPTLEGLPFVGRDRQLEEMLDRVAESFPEPIVVSGSAGTGKTRLLSEFGRRCSRPVLASQAFRSLRDQPWGLGRSLVREALALDAGAAQTISDRGVQALADVVPELEELRSLSEALLDPESRRVLAVEAAIRVLEAVSPKTPVIVADNLQWADATSLELLSLVLERAPRIGLIVAYRPEEIAADSAAAGFLANLDDSAADPLTVPLGALPAEAISQLVADEDLVSTIKSETDATPFAAIELLRALAAAGVIEPERHGRWRARARGAGQLARELARTGQRRAIEARVKRHTRSQRQTLALLALLGREASARLLAAAQDVSQANVLEDLDALARAHLVHLGDRGWGAQHELISEIFAQSLNRSERGRLHGLLARALSSQGGDYSEVGRHLVGAGDPDAAADAFAQAARHSLERFANDEAEHLSDAGLELDPNLVVRSCLLEIRAEARARKGQLPRAREDLQAALGTKQPGPDRSRILTKIAMLTSGFEDYLRARELVELALTEAGADPVARAEALAAGARLDMNLGRLDRAEKGAAEALTLFEQIGDANGLADVLDTRVNIELHGSLLLAATAPKLDQLARLFKDAGRLLRVGTPRSNYGYLLMALGRFDEALSNIDEALDLESTLGHPEGEAYCLWHRSEVLATMGRVQEARESAEDALTIARRLGHREWTAAALRGLGVVCFTAGDLVGAEHAFRECLQVAEGIPIFASWAASGLARTLVARGDFSGAEHYVTLALSEGTAATQHESRLARAELAVASGDSNAQAIVLEALDLAQAGGGVVIAERLKELAAAASRVL